MVKLLMQLVLVQQPSGQAQNLVDGRFLYKKHGLYSA
ncbi:hypothetical protein swp_1414 [Shewanella piezotolerans WP3]|uniref:Uncharacterized protein n=1 Tax=Shewanella piezotolerans (strain WP3 / JCM 13877) TaxID=225849 RepID=B8CKM4_SHEPW|nr:hypothetical protein swp_1414 [Shewanella piezotolerans WP3]